jgi:cysteine-S-conjugate beta-lyase
MTLYHFDQTIERRGTDSNKWQKYDRDVLPLWVADMDFAAPPAVTQALQDRVAHGIFGYGGEPAELSELICDRLWQRYRWSVTPAELIFLPGLVSGLNAVCRAVCPPGSGVLVQTPVYPPFLSAPGNQGLALDIAELMPTLCGQQLHYTIDFDAFADTIQPHTRLFILCNPHNPVGRCFTREELTRLAEICAQRDLIICADEIHNELLLDNSRHIPIATLSPAIAERCITLMAPSKTFNVAGLYCGFAIVQNPELRQRLERATRGIVPHVNVLGLTAALAAFRAGENWHKELLVYLTANRDFLVDYVQEHVPALRTTVPEGTFLAWFDCRTANIRGDPYEFFLQKAKVAFNPGTSFGTGGEGFVRLNFGCTRAVLAEALARVQAALSAA